MITRIHLPAPTASEKGGLDALGVVAAAPVATLGGSEELLARLALA